jgi:acyl transferase domain-containing protein
MTGEEIAVVGLAGRFPGAADVTGFWANLLDGVDAIHDHSDEELRAAGIPEALLADPLHVKATGQLAGVEDFDSEFFGVDDDEARRMDPQQRLFLETAWNALADAGYRPGAASEPVGLFTASGPNRYFLFHLLDNPDVTGIPDHDWEGRLGLTGSLPGQVAYRLDLTGPVLGVQAACSSSLVAVALAAQNLNDFRCDLALAGGVSVTWPRYRYTTGGLVSPDGRCRAFDADGQGSGFGSGVGVVVLRRLADAIENGDYIYAVLRGWAVGNDGRSRAGYAVPGLAGQSATIAEALAVAEVDPARIGFVEAHGSGTRYGDAIEVAALSRAYGGNPAGSCALGSVKTNIGHLDEAAGIAGLVKAILAVRDGKVPANLHFATPNPEIEFGQFFVPTKTQDWPLAGPRLAGVSAFGQGGTNAHVVLGEAPSRPPGPARPGWHALPLSARTPEALRDMVIALRAALLSRPGLELSDVGYTLAAGRTEFAHRAVVLGMSLDEAVARLDPAQVRLPDEADPALAGAARRWLDGASVDWTALTNVGRRVPLPGYPFQRRRYWIAPPGHDRLRGTR